MNQRKQYLKKCSDIQQFKRPADILPKLCLSCWKSHSKHVALCVSAFLKDHTESIYHQEQINMSYLSNLSSPSLSFITAAAESTRENSKTCSCMG